MYSLDTNIVIAIINRSDLGIEKAFRALAGKRGLLFISSIVMFELRYGYAKSDRTARMGELLTKLLSAGIDVLPFDAEDAAVSGSIRSHLEAAGTPIGSYDLLIAGQARRRDLTLVTRNRREFDRVPELRVTDWTDWATPAG